MPRGLANVALVTSDAHAGLLEAITATLPGASWQRCRTHYAANLMAANLMAANLMAANLMAATRRPPGPGTAAMWVIAPRTVSSKVSAPAFAVTSCRS